MLDSNLDLLCKIVKVEPDLGANNVAQETEH
jgi:hypothetical protein